MRNIMIKKLLIFAFISIIIVPLARGQQDTMTLSIVEATGSGSCGDSTDCSSNQICFNLIGVPSSGIIGYQVANYDIWLSTTGGQAIGATLPIISETSCIAFNTTDLVGNAGNIRVGANDVGGNPTDFVSGDNIIHNFCISYNNLAELQAVLTGASPGLPGGSAMSASIAGDPMTTLDVFLTEATLVLSSNTVSCILTPDTISIVVPADSTFTVCVDTTELPGNLNSIASCGDPNNGGTLSNPNSTDGCIDYMAPSTPGTTDAFCIVFCDDGGSCDTTIVIVTVPVLPTTCPAIVITQPDPWICTITPGTDVSCNGFADGSFSVSASGATSPYVYDDGSTTNTDGSFTGLAAGTYSITITDANGCTTTCDDVIIGEPDALTCTITPGTEVSCNGFADGSFSVSAVGGTSPYVYDDGSTTNTDGSFTGLDGGTYSVTITDANGCTTTCDDVIITEPAALTCTITPGTDVSCNGFADGSFSVSAVGGTSPYVYDDGATTNTDGSFTGLAAGSYSITITDANGCTTTCSDVLITQPDALTCTIDGSTNETCNEFDDGTISVSAVGGTSPYVYDDGATTNTDGSFTGLAAGSYSITITDANGCTTTCSDVLITQPDALTCTIDGSTNETCNEFDDGTINVSAVGGTSPYVYDDGSTTNTDGSFTGLAAGSYSITITDANGCTTTCDDVLITQPDALTCTIDGSTNETCNEFDDGTISVSAVGGTSPYVYDDGSTTNTDGSFTGLAAGSYSITITDANGCTTTCDDVLITQPDALTCTIDGSTNETCNEFDDGTINVSAVGGTSPYVYDDGSTTNTDGSFTGLAAGSYSITITDANGCTTTCDDVLITQPDALTCTIDGSTNETCNEFDDGTINVSAVGGTSPYVYDDGSTTNTDGSFTGLAAGSYSITITDANGCTTTCSDVLITQPDALTCTIDGSTNETCNEFDDGTINVSAVGGTSPYVYDDGSTTNTDGSFTGLAAGSYSITITDANGCTTTCDDVLITQPDALTCTIDGSTNETCNEFDDGTINVSAVGGTSPYVYDDGSTTNTDGSFTGLAAGSYSITITDANGCTTTCDDVLIMQPDALTCTIDGSTNETCNEFDDGTISVSAVGGTSPYVYDDGTTTNTDGSFTGLAAGSYSITITDANGCTTTCDDVLITQPDALTCTIDGSTNETCNEFDDGTINVSAVGGTSPYVYDDGSTTNTDGSFTGLAAGSYSITITDANGCTTTCDDVLITQPDALTCTIDGSTNETCNEFDDGTISVSAVGGTSPYVYDDGSTTNTDGSFTGLAAGSYSITITDANGCTTTCDDVLITQPDALTCTIDGSTNETCNEFDDGTISVSAVGGTSPYVYDDGSTTNTDGSFTGLAAGSYSITITDANGCTTTCDDVLITQPDALTCTIDGSTNETCNEFDDGTISVSAVGGTSPYVYDDGSTTNTDGSFTGLAAGSYSITITDANGCTTTCDDVLITQPDALTCTIDGSTNETCNEFDDGTINVSAVGGTSPYVYDDGSTTNTDGSFTGLAAGSYSITITDANGCTTTCDDVLITQPDALTCTIDGSTNETCNEFDDGTINVSAVGGTSPYVYDDGSTTNTDGSFTGLAAGSYSITITDANGCTTTCDDVLITQPDALTCTIDGSTNETCNEFDDGTISVSAVGGTSPYVYDDGSTTNTDGSFTGLAAGSYSITITDANGCTTTCDDVLIMQPDALTCTIDGSTNETCNEFDDGTISVSAVGGTSPYVYDDGTTTNTDGSFTGLAAGSYSITITDANGCTTTCDDVLITQPDALTCTIDGSTNETCNEFDDGTINVSAVGGTSPYVYDDGSTTNTDGSFTGLAAGSYSITITDANGCTTTCDDVLITQPDALTCTIDGSTNETCNEFDDGTINVSAVGGTSPYVYDDGSTTNTDGSFTGLAAGSYSITITDANGCTTTCDDVLITQPDALTCTIDGSTNETCNEFDDGTINVSAVGGTSPYVYDDGSTTNTDGSFTGLAAGSYSITITDANGCTTTCDDVLITQPDALTCTIDGSTNETCNEFDDGTINVSAVGGTSPYVYDDGSTTNTDGSFTGLAAGSYSITITDANGCTTTCDDVLITQPDALACTIDGSTNETCNEFDDGTINVSAVGGTSPYVYDDGSTTNTDGSFTGLAAGSYSITITDANGCTTTCSDVLITQPDALTCTIDGSTNETCNEFDDGTISVSAVGGTSPYVYDDGSTTNTDGSFTGLAAGSYSITITDANGCTTTCDDVLITQPDALTCTIDGSTNETCNEFDDGTINVSAVGGTSPYVYDDGSTTNTDGSFTGLAAGSYSITITDANGCTTTCDDVLITQPDALTCTIDGSTNETCNEFDDGTINVSAVGGTSPYVYDDGSTTNTDGSFTGLAAGSYSITITDANGCTTTCDDVLITQPDALTCTIDGSTNETCNEFDDGTINVGAVGGTSPYVYDDGSTTNTDGSFTGLAAGSYSITITDANGCTTTCDDVLITQPDALTCTIDGSTNETCNEFDDGTINVSAVGGTSPYVYDDGSTTNTDGSFTGLAAGSYSITITDANGCTTTCDDVLITQPDALTCTIDGSTNETCNEFDDGTINVSAVGGTSPYVYDDGSTTNTDGSFTGLAAGSYSITITDANGCTTTCDDVLITQPDALTCTIDGSTNETCNEFDDGTISVSAVGGTSPYVYDDGSTTNTDGSFTGLAAGSYSITITDANGCTTTCDDVLITQPDALTCTIDGSTNETCNEFDDGTINVSAVGGTSPYVYDDGSTTNTDGSFTGLAAGSYSITITDANGCTTTCDDVLITQPDALTCTIDGSTNETCNEFDDGTINVSAVGGTSPYVYDDGSTTNTDGSFTGLAAGSYSITITDANGCTTTCDDVLITQPDALTCTIDGSTNETCNEFDDGTISVSAVGGTSPYVYDDGSTTNTDGSFTGLAAGSYSITITDANGCTTTCDDVLITQPGALTCTIDGSTNETCNEFDDGTINVSAVGGTSPYVYDDGSTTNTDGSFTGLAAGSYSITITDANGCTTTCDDVLITQPDALTCTVIGSSGGSCNDLSNGTINVIAVGGTSPYVYDDGSTTNTDGAFAGLTAGTYSITITDANGCTTTCPDIEVDEPTPLTCTIDGSTNETCNEFDDGTINVSAGGGSPPYVYDDGTTTNTDGSFTGLAAGSYSITITDANGCTTTCDDVLITQPDALTCTIDGSTNETCNEFDDGTINVSAVGGTSPYVYDDGSTTNTDGSFTGLAAGSYSITITDANGCTTTCDDVLITQPDALTCTIDGSTNETCNEFDDGTISVSAVGGTSPYVYDDGSTTNTDGSFTGLAAGSYSITITDANGCTTTCDDVLITQPDALTCTIDGSTNETCNEFDDGTISVSAVGGTSPYVYDDGSTTNTDGSFTGLAAGSYSITITDANGCTTTCDDVLITQPDALTCTIDGSTNETCNEFDDGTINVSAVGGTSPYVYDDGSTTNTDGSFTGLAAGSYSITITDANGCTTTCDDVLITQPDALTCTIDGSTNETCNEFDDGTINVSAVGGTSPYVYDDGSTTNTDGSFTGLAAGSYSITITDANGCTTTCDDVLITQPDALTCTIDGSTNETCNEFDDGTINVSAVGGTSPYVYDDGSTTNTDGSFTGLAAGSYSITITDANGCTTTCDDVLITQPDALTCTIDGSTNETCNEFDDGTISVSAVGGTSPYVYDDGSTTNTDGSFTGLAAGSYSITITDANGCTTTCDDVLITQPDALTCTIDGSTNETCNEFDDGTINVSAVGGTGPYVYDDGSTTNTDGSFTGLAAGSYSITITDANGCTTTCDDVLITQPDALTCTVIGSSGGSCNDLSNGTINVSAVGGTSPYVYDDGSTTNTDGAFTGLTAGTYSITITDANGCTTTCPDIEVDEPTPLTCTIDGSTNETCNEFDDGTINVSAVGGSPPYVYDDGTTTNTDGSFTGLAAGSYSITITDANGCTTTCDDVLITQPDALTCTIDGSTNETCNEFDDGTINVSAVGGSPPYVYDDGTTTNTDGSFTGLAAGSYSITITDANGCTTTCDDVLITQPDALTCTIDGSTNETCNEFDDGTISVSAVGGTSPYVYDDGSTTNTDGSFTGLAAGSYSITITDANGCTTTCDDVLITQPDALTCTIDGSTNETCNEFDDGTINVSAVGGTSPYVYDNGSTTNTDGSFTGLAAGSYSITITDANGCTTTCDDVLIGEPQAVTCTITGSEDVSCNGYTDGTISVLAGGGTGPYVYDDGNTTNTDGSFTGLAAGSYSITITDANGCTTTCDDVLIGEPQAVTCTITGSEDVSCNGYTDGTISVLAGGGTGPYVYDDGNTTNTDGSFTGLAAGSYSITITDANGCTTTCDDVLIGEPQAVTCTITGSEDVSCNGYTDGTISVLAGGGTGPYVYDDGNTTNTDGSFTGLAAGTYSITITDANGCTTTCDDVLIGEPQAVTCTITGSEDVSCNGYTDGTISVLAGGGTGPYVYDDGNTTNTDGSFTGLAAGSYSITITDANGCTTTCDDVLIGEPQALTCTITGSEDVSCNGYTDGTISVFAGGGTGPYVYDDGNTTNTDGSFTGLAAGSYSITITDANGCTTTCDDVLIGEPQALTCTITGSEDVSCNGYTDGTISVLAGGGTGPYVYDDGNTTNTDGSFTGLAAGSYSITITDANGCTTTCDDVLIGEPQAVTCTITGSEDVSCNGYTDGTISVLAGGGTGPYVYDDGNTTNTDGSFTGLAAGSYSITITDANGCTTTCDDVLIGEPQALTCTITGSEDVSCNGYTDGTISVLAGGGTGPYVYDDGNTTNTDGSFTGLAAGSYSITITDANGCTTTCDDVLIGEPQAVTCTITGSEDVSCNGYTDGTISVLAGGGTGPYVYDDGNTTNTDGSFTGLAAGSYSITITDANGCTTTCDDVLIGEPQAVTCTITGSEDVSCNGYTDGTISVFAGGGTGPYVYDDGNTTNTDGSFTGLAAGSYSITITDANGCTTTCDDVLIGEPQAVTCTITGSEDVSCNGYTDGTISVFAGGGTGPYVYDDGNTTNTDGSFTGLAAGSYSITITDANGCTTTCDDVLIGEPQALTCTITGSEDVSCNGYTDGTISVLAGGGTGPYVYDDGNTTNTDGSFTGLAAGSYSITITDANGCTTTCDDVLIGEPQAVTCTITGSEDVSCNGYTDGTISVLAGGGTGPYVYDDGNTTNTDGSFTGLAAGSYSITITDANGCTTTCDDVLIGEPQALTCTITGSEDVSCNGYTDGTISVLAGGGTGPYVYDDGNTTNTDGSFTGLAAGSYSITITDANGCTTTCDDVLIGEPQAVTCTITGSEDVSCNGYTDGTISVLAGGGTGPYVYDDGNTTNTDGSFTGLAAGSYSITITDANGCTTTCDDVLITQPDALTCTIDGSTNETCNEFDDGTINVSAVGGTSPYVYDDGSTTNTDGSFTGLAAGSYSITITDANGCTTTCDDVLITQPDALSCTIDGSTNETCNEFDDGTINVSAVGGTGPYVYDDGSTTNTDGSFTGLAAGSYSITITDANGCTTTCDDVLITQPDALTCTVIGSSGGSCNDLSNGTINVSAVGGTSPYVYDDGSTTNTDGSFTGLAAGSYSITITDANGCTTTCDDVLIGEPQAVTCTITGSEDVSCNGYTDGTISVLAGGGTGPYVYDDGNTTNTDGSFTGLAAGSYSITITDANGCTTTCDDVLIGEPQAVTCTITGSEDVSCNGYTDGTISVFAGGGTGPYVYDDGNTTNTDGSFTGLAAGSYSITITDANGCTTTCDDVLIGEPQAVTCTITGSEDVSCNGYTDGTISVLAGGGPYV